MDERVGAHDFVPFPRTEQVRRDFELLERLKDEALRDHTLTPAECIDLVSQLSELFPRSERRAVRYEFDDSPGKVRL